METLKASRTIVDITIDGKNITGDLANYIIDVTFNDKTSCEVDDITIQLEDSDDLFSDEWMPTVGDSLTVSIVTTLEDGSQEILECGDFEIDLVTNSGPPERCEIKAVNTFTTDIRKVLRHVQWKNTTFSAIVTKIAQTYGLEYEFITDTVKYANEVLTSTDDIDIFEINQNDESDLAFLVRLAEDYGYVIKLDNEKITVCAQTYLEKQDPVAEFSKVEISNRQAGRQGFNLYKEAKVSYYSPRTGRSIKAQNPQKEAEKALIKKVNPEAASRIYTTKSNKKTPKKSNHTPTKPVAVYSNNGGSKTLVIRQSFKDAKTAEQFAAIQLKKKNEGEWRLGGEVKGCVFLLAGTVISIEDYGQYDGLWYVEETTHTVASNGYRTSFAAHKISNTGNY